MARIFLSHASKDRALTDAIRTQIGTQHELFLDYDPEAGIQLGAEWERTLYERLQSADAVICVVTPNYLASQWCFAEVAVAKGQGCLLLPLAAEGGVRHPLLEPIQGLDYSADPKSAMSRIARRLAALDAAGGLAWDSTRPIFPGLAAFDTEDRAVFFGREDEVTRLAAELRARITRREPRGVVVVGASGSGKSSLVRAGLIPRLLEDPAWWRVRPIVPGRNPMAAMARELARACKEVGMESGLDTVSARLSAGTDGLTQVANELLVSASGERRQLLVVIDQLEEVFTRTSDADRAQFFTVLSAAASDPDSPISVLATLRSEFLTQLLKTPSAAPLRERPFALGPLGEQFLEDVIIRPARKADITFDPELARRLVQDTGTGEALPLLAFTLSRLVDGVQAGGRVGLDRYEQTGGVQGAVKAQSEAALSRATRTAGCNDDEAMATLIGFVTLDDDGRPTRRRRRRDDLTPAGSSVADAFVEARLLTSDSDDRAIVLGVTHETLFTAWPRLATAIEKSKADLRLRRSLERDAAGWELEKRPPSLLWRGERLARAAKLVKEQKDVAPSAQAFVEASTKGATEAATRESAMLIDRVIGARLHESDPELALLCLLAAADEYARTPDVVAALRRTLAVHRLMGRLELEREALAASVSDDGQLVAVADRGTNERVRASTRRRPLPPAGSVNVSLWRLGETHPHWNVAITGRDAGAVAWSDDATTIVVGADDRVVWLDADGGAVARQIDAGKRVTSLVFAPGGGQLQIGLAGAGGQELRLLDKARDWAVPKGPPTPNDLRRLFGEPAPDVKPPRRYSRLIQCPRARRVVDLSGMFVEVWAGDPVDHPVEVQATEVGGVAWVLVPNASDPQRLLASDPSGKLRCGGRPLKLFDSGSGIASPLAWSFAVAASFSADGRRLALASRTALAIIDVASGTLLKELGCHGDEEGDTYSSVSLNHDGTKLACGSLGGGRAHLWTVNTGERGMQLNARSVGFSPDGNSIAASHSGAAFVIDPSNGSRIELGGCAAQSFSFAPDGSGLIAVGADGATEYSLRDRNVAAQYPGPIGAVAFSTDSRHALIRTGGRIMRYPDRTADAVLARARRAVYRELSDEERLQFALHRNREVHGAHLNDGAGRSLPSGS
jgi:hypothetical protein